MEPLLADFLMAWAWFTPSPESMKWTPWQGAGLEWHGCAWGVRWGECSHQGGRQLCGSWALTHNWRKECRKCSQPLRYLRASSQAGPRLQYPGNECAMAWPLGWPPGQEPTALRTARAVPRGAQGKFSQHEQAARRAAWSRGEAGAEDRGGGLRSPQWLLKGSDIPPGA